MSDHELRAIAFPMLDDKQIAAIAQCTATHLKNLKAGHVLFSVGDRDFKFFVVKSGEVEIIDPTGDKPRTIVVHVPREFTGDVSHLTGNPSVVTALARTDCEVYEISGEALRQMLNKCPELADVILQAFLARRQLLRQPENFTGLRVIGSRFSRDTFRIRDFLSKNRQPFTWFDLESDQHVDILLKQFGVTEEETPIVACAAELLLRNPSNRELAEAIGIRRPLEKTVYDLAVVGAGPAGLAATVYAASEGLATVLLDRTAAGGQAGSSMRIENYLGFPSGITGGDLVDRALLQVHRFEATVSIPTPTLRLTFDNGYSVLELDGETLATKCLLIATGAEYRRLQAEGCERFEGSGVYYAATANELQVCRGADVAVVGGGNSAGQAAVYLAQNTRKVHLIVRSNSLYKQMSAYLASRIEGTGNIEVVLNTEVRQMHGDLSLNAVELLNKETGEARSLALAALFSFIGAIPRTDWLGSEIETDSRGFVCTGHGLTRWQPGNRKRDPFLLETSRPGVFAAGDVRSGSIKRVAAAVGEGSMAVQFVHEYLKEM